MFSPGSPPGVDAPTFLHLGWITELALTGHLTPLHIDPYWYGGYPYLQSYPPLGYGLIGLVSAATPIPVEIAYRLILVLAFAGLGLAVYALALELGVRQLGACMAGLLLLTSYPALMGMAVYGWFSTFVSLPLAITGLTLLERSLRLHNRPIAVASGLFFASAVLTHHMTGFAFAVALVPWLAYKLVNQRKQTLRVLQLTLLSAGTTFALASIWSVFFLSHLLEVGFQREVPGIWQVSLPAFSASLFDRSSIGIEAYPAYLGVAQITLGIAGLSYALLTRSRVIAIVPMFLAMLWFAAGQDVNPLIRLYPFSGLDVARFSLFLMPFLAVFAGLLLGVIATRVKDASPRLTRSGSARLRHPTILSNTALSGVVALTLIFPIADFVAARPAFTPVTQEPDLVQALAWIEEETPPDATLLAVGLRHWSSWWIPYHTGRPVMDGWNDEGAAAWRPIRQVRHMAWEGEVDVFRLHEIMLERNTGYIVISQWFPFEHPDAFRQAVDASPHLYSSVAEWTNVAIYEIVH